MDADVPACRLVLEASLCRWGGESGIVMWGRAFVVDMAVQDPRSLGMARDKCRCVTRSRVMDVPGRGSMSRCVPRCLPLRSDAPCVPVDMGSREGWGFR